LNWAINLAREQHIRREKATSNICTSQALLANMAAMYAVYHGPAGLKRIAAKVHGFTQVLKTAVEKFGYKATNSEFFDTLTFDVSGTVKNADLVHAAALQAGINLRAVDDKHVGVTLDESVSPNELVSLINVFASSSSSPPISLSSLIQIENPSIPPSLHRTSDYLTNPVFNKHHSEAEMTRYINLLASKDLSLIHSMISLGSCTMKLNSTSSMIPLTWPEFGGVHPFAPLDQVKGYQQIIKVCGHVSGVLSIKHIYLGLFSRNSRRTCAKSPVSMHAPFSQIPAPLENTQDSV
jgi:glycine dehydrogenase